MKKKFRYLLISLFKYNQPTTEKPTSIYKMGGPNVDLSLIFFCFLIIPFNFGYLHIINSGSRKCIYKNSSDNLTKLLMIHEIYSCQWMILKKIKVLYIYIYIYICDNLLNCQQPPQHIHLKEKKQVLIIKK